VAATPISCVVCGDLGTVDILLNIALFVPLGFGLRLAGFSWRRAVVLSALTTLLVELLQMEVIPGRDASLSDVLTNTLGGAVGAWLGTHWRRLALPSPTAARRLALGWSVGLAWVWAGTAWSLAPAFQQGIRWYGAWAPDFDNFRRFPGRPLLVTAGGEVVLPGLQVDQRRFEDAINARPEMTFEAILAGPPDGLAPIGAIVDASHAEIMLIGQDRSDLVFRLRMRAALVRLRTPAAVLPGALAGRTGDSAIGSAALREGTLRLAAEVSGREASRTIPLNAGWGWMLVSPWDARLDGWARIATSVWIAGLLGVLAFWASSAGGKTIAVVPATAVILFIIVPRAASFPSVTLPDWIAALVGSLAGAGLAVATRSRRTQQAPEVGR